MRIVFYANNKLAIPVFQYLVMNRWVAGLCLPEADFELKNQFQQIAQWSQVPVLEVNAENIDKLSSGWLKLIQPSLGMVFTFPYKIPQSLIKSAEQGFFNVHFGKLPKYRGAEPLFWNMVNQEKEVCVTIHKMSQKFDSGPIAYEEPVAIGKNDSYGVLQKKLAQSSVMIVYKFLTNVQIDKLNLVNQNATTRSPLAKPSYADVRINWEEQTAKQIAVLLRAVNPWNKGAITYCDGQMVRILLGSETEIQEQNRRGAGSFFLGEALNKLYVETIEGALFIEAIYLEDGFFNASEFYHLSIQKKFNTDIAETV